MFTPPPPIPNKPYGFCGRKANVYLLTYVGERGVVSKGSRLEVWMKSHKSEVAITEFLFAPTRKQCRLSTEMNTWTLAATANKQPAPAGTLGEKGTLLAQRTSFDTLDNWSHRTPTQSKKDKEKKGYRVMAWSMYIIHLVTSPLLNHNQCPHWLIT